MTVKIKKGDTVKVIAGKDKGAEGKVIQVLRERDRVIVEGVNRVKKHTKTIDQGGRAGKSGGIITTEAAIHISNVMLVSGKGTTRAPGAIPATLPTGIRNTLAPEKPMTSASTSTG